MNFQELELAEKPESGYVPHLPCHWHLKLNLSFFSEHSVRVTGCGRVGTISLRLRLLLRLAPGEGPGPSLAG